MEKQYLDKKLDELFDKYAKTNVNGYDLVLPPAYFIELVKLLEGKQT